MEGELISVMSPEGQRINTVGSTTSSFYLAKRLDTLKNKASVLILGTPELPEYILLTGVAEVELHKILVSTIPVC